MIFAASRTHLSRGQGVIFKARLCSSFRCHSHAHNTGVRGERHKHFQGKRRLSDTAQDQSANSDRPDEIHRSRWSHWLLLHVICLLGDKLRHKEVVTRACYVLDYKEIYALNGDMRSPSSSQRKTLLRKADLNQL
jgi:hypothetical protein